MTRPAFLDIVSVGIIKYGGNVESWIRSTAHNASISPAGHPNSFHLSGEAVDAWFHTREDAELFKEYCDRRLLSTKWNGTREVSKTVHVQVVAPTNTR